jgi:hypothetical protein
MQTTYYLPQPKHIIFLVVRGVYHSITIHEELNMFAVRATFPKQQAYTCERVTEIDISDLNAGMLQ